MCLYNYHVSYSEFALLELFVFIQNRHCSRLMRAMSTMARREGKDGALHFFNLQEQTDVSFSLIKV